MSDIVALIASQIPPILYGLPPTTLSGIDIDEYRIALSAIYELTDTTMLSRIWGDACISEFDI
jgi:hypothetical protein